jgi:hypothetical protein
LHDVVTVATGQAAVDGLVVTPLTVTWATPNAVRSCALAGACATPITIFEASLVGTLAAQGEGVLMPNKGAASVVACPTGRPCSGGNIGYDLGDLQAIAVEGSHTFVVDALGMRILHCDTATGCPSPWPALPPGKVDNGAALAVSATRVYWSRPGANGAVFTCLRSGCTAVQLADQQANPRRIAVDAKALFWTNFDDGTVWSCPLDGCGAGPRLIAKNQNAPLAVASDGAHVYWASYAGGTVMRCEADGCVTPTLFAKGLTNPSAIALSPSDVYVASASAGTVIKIAK